MQQTRPSGQSIRPARTTGGLSLIEVMVAICVLTVALLAMFSAFGTANDTARMADSRDDVLDQVRRVVDEIQAQDAATIATNVTASSSTYDQVVYGLQPPSGRAKVIQVRKIANPVGASASLTAMRVSAQWLRGTVTENYTTVYYHAAR